MSEWFVRTRKLSKTVTAKNLRNNSVVVIANEWSDEMHATSI